MQQQQNSGLQEFTLFPELPAELRLKIWDFALPGPNVITVELDDSNWAIRGARPLPKPKYTFENSPTPPIHLQVNIESRIHALKSY